MKKIDWDKVWTHFNKWADKKLGFIEYPDNEDWVKQKKKIQSLVEAQLKPKKKNISAWRQQNRRKKHGHK